MFIRVVGVIIALCVLAYWMSPAHAAPCPTVSITLVCMQVTEPTTLTNGLPLTDYQETRFYPMKNGAVLPVIAIPATGPSGGGIVSSVLPTTACRKDTYSVDASGKNAVGESVHTAPLSLIKDRLNEPPCVVPGPPSPFLLQ